MDKKTTKVDKVIEKSKKIKKEMGKTLTGSRPDSIEINPTSDDINKKL